MTMRRWWAIGVCFWLAVSAVAQPRFERMAALHQSVVSIHEASGIAGLFTYDHDPAYWLEYLALGKLLVGVRQGESVRWLHEARDLKVRNIPGCRGNWHGRWAVDAEDGTAYAWIGFDDIVEVP